MQRPRSKRDRWCTAVTAVLSRSTCSTHSSDALLLRERTVDFVAHQVGQVIGQIVERLVAGIARTRQVNRNDGLDASRTCGEPHDAIHKRDYVVEIGRAEYHPDIPLPPNL